MKINTYAKINLNLKISKDIDDGLHNISSLIVPIDLYDSIEINETNNDVDNIRFDIEVIPKENTI
jgi:4-diphosphocytidyl-2-C-methyl-D-erythritol kinase